jgi:hypothetical protein
MTNDNTSAMEACASPSPRTIGWVWILYFATGIIGALFTRGIIISTDAAATATNILAHASLYRAGFAVDLVSNLIYIALSALLFAFFRRVNPTLALLAAVFSLVGCTVQIMGEVLRLAPSVVLANAQLAAAFGAPQVHAAALLSIILYRSVFQISFVLFACFELVTGVLILRSKFLPRWLGWWWLAGGAAWLTFLWQPLATTIWPVLIVAGAAELALPVWLLVKGVDRSALGDVHSTIRRDDANQGPTGSEPG